MKLQSTSQVDEQIVRNRSCLRARIYGDDPYHVEPFPGSEIANLNRTSDGERKKCFWIERNGEMVATALARLTPRLGDHQTGPYGLIGHFEAEHNSAAVRKLLGTCVEWLQREGAGRILGPINGDTWHSYRFNLGPFEPPPFLMEPYNPGYYPFLWSNAGFGLDQTYHSIRVEHIDKAKNALRDRYQSVRRQRYTFEPLDLERLDQQLRRTFQMTRRIFRGNYLYTDLEFSEFRSLYDGIDQIAHPRLTWFATGPDGNDAGYIFALPDYRRAVAVMNGQKSVWSKLKFKALCRTNTVNIKTAGVMPGHRRKGLASALAYKVYENLEALEFDNVNICLIMDGNPSSGLDGGTGTLLRRYGLYEWKGT